MLTRQGAFATRPASYSGSGYERAPLSAPYRPNSYSSGDRVFHPDRSYLETGYGSGYAYGESRHHYPYPQPVAGRFDAHSLAMRGGMAASHRTRQYMPSPSDYASYGPAAARYLGPRTGGTPRADLPLNEFGEFVPSRRYDVSPPVPYPVPHSEKYYSEGNAYEDPDSRYQPQPQQYTHDRADTRRQGVRVDQRDLGYEMSRYRVDHNYLREYALRGGVADSTRPTRQQFADVDYDDDHSRHGRNQSAAPHMPVAGPDLSYLSPKSQSSQTTHSTLSSWERPGSATLLPPSAGVEVGEDVGARRYRSQQESTEDDSFLKAKLGDLNKPLVTKLPSGSQKQLGDTNMEPGSEPENIPYFYEHTSSS
jgi:hypothetical protein